MAVDVNKARNDRQPADVEVSSGRTVFESPDGDDAVSQNSHVGDDWIRATPVVNIPTGEDDREPAIVGRLRGGRKGRGRDTQDERDEPFEHGVV